MLWARGLGAHDPSYYQYESALADDPDTLVAVEGLRVTCKYRPSVLGKPEVTNLSLLIGSERVYALDHGRWYRHKNNKGGRGRPFWGQSFVGSHQHFWSDDGYGYAEPLDEPANPQDAWQKFLELGNFKAEFAFVHPLSGTDAAQGVLEV